MSTTLPNTLFWKIRILIVRFSWGCGWLADLNLKDEQWQMLDELGIKPFSFGQVIRYTGYGVGACAALLGLLSWYIGIFEIWTLVNVAGLVGLYILLGFVIDWYQARKMSKN